MKLKGCIFFLALLGFLLLEWIEKVDFLLLDELLPYTIICSGLGTFEKVMKLFMIELLLMFLIL